MGEAAEEELARMKDLERFSSIHFRTSLSSKLDMEYMHPKGGLAPSRRAIAWSTYECGGKALASLSGKSER